MSDFFLRFGSEGLRELDGRLRARPGMQDAEVHRWSFAWGHVVLQEPRGVGYAPAEIEGERVACIGRPRLVGIEHERDGAQGFCRSVAAQWREHGPQRTHDALTGMFAVLGASADGVRLLTDQMGYQPIFSTTCEATGDRLLGTNVEILAELAGRASDFDKASLGELIVFGNATFPYTTRTAIQELEPGSEYVFDAAGTQQAWTRLWEPCEETFFTNTDEAVDAIEHALRRAGDDVTRGCTRVAVTLSGGMDSRTVLSVVPPERRAAALTYANEWNREVETAARIAESFSVPHVVAQRDEEFYSHLMLDRGPALLGTELRAAAHGFCVLDNDLQGEYDLILGGQLSDTFLKDHFMPEPQKEALRTKLWPERLRRARARLVGRRVAPSAIGPQMVSGRQLLLPHLEDDVRAEIEMRRRERVDALREIRPHSAEEWVRFWPCSRQDDFADVAGSTKQFAFDSLFMHRAILELTMHLGPRLRHGGWLANRAFLRVMGEAAKIPNANTQKLPDTSPRAVAQSRRSSRQRKRQATDLAPAAGGRSASAAPWTGVQGSWVDGRLLQLHSPAWHAFQQTLVDSPALSVLAAVIQGPEGRAVLEYDPTLPPGMNALAVQVARVLHWSLAPRA